MYKKEKSMNNNTVGFIGTGNMGGVLVRAVAKAIGGEALLLCDRDPKKVRELGGETGATVSVLSSLVERSDYIFLGVKPQVLPDLLKEIAPTLKANPTCTLISMAAGVSIKAITEIIDTPLPIIRIMPNTAAAVGEGMILYCKNDAVSPEALSDFTEMMKLSGRLSLLDEGLIDAAGCVSGCGPAFVYMFIEALADGGVECGLPRDKAVEFAAQTLLGAAKTVLSSGKHPGALKDEVCSPGGTTIKGVHALENGKFRACVMDAVNAAYKRTLEIKK